MKELLKQLAAYNCWAHQRIIDTILALPDEKQVERLPSSFPNLQKTLLHMWDAESIWWQRMKLYERFVRPSDNFTGSARDAANGLLSQSKLWAGWVANANDFALDHVFQYITNNNKQPVKMQVCQMLVHVFNHGTYHRGQLVTMLRQLGVEKIPQLDFSYWVQNKR